MAKAKNCKNCNNGKHNVPEVFCFEACQCWCRIGGSTRFVPVRRTEWAFGDISGLLNDLADYGVEVRVTTAGRVLWKPQPSEWPESLRTAMRAESEAVAAALTPGAPMDLAGRPFWGNGGASPCVSCHRLTVMRDPLRIVRHSWCGWVKQIIQ